jgi:metal-responsive CopG/Arc/MetJ family transcriptional regulator
MKPDSVSAVRASISFPTELYERLEAMAKRKKVSLAWVVRDAAEKYIASAEGNEAGSAPQNAASPNRRDMGSGNETA